MICFQVIKNTLDNEMPIIIQKMSRKPKFGVLSDLVSNCSENGPIRLQELGQEGAGPQPGQLRGGRVQREGQQA